jgi:hypothetical protein
VGVSKTVADRYDRLFRWPDRSGLSQGAGGLVFDVHYHIMQDQTSMMAGSVGAIARSRRLGV